MACHSVGELVVNVRIEQEPSAKELTWRERLWLRLFRRLPVRSELRREVRPLRLAVAQLQETAVKLETRIRVLACPKHAYQLVVGSGVEGFTPRTYFGGPDYFAFRCRHCGHQTQKTVAQMTAAERRALADLGLLPNETPAKGTGKKGPHTGGVVKLQ
ncbi:MAG: hypothetical protein EHM35_00760 [Planctomycetaceae bacterium]|nr:MAG: hypothetical protein EHM35_00760 [Planctomycetaceae bacterium]